MSPPNLITLASSTNGALRPSTQAAFFPSAGTSNSTLTTSMRTTQGDRRTIRKTRLGWLSTSFSPWNRNDERVRLKAARKAPKPGGPVSLSCFICGADACPSSVLLFRSHLSTLGYSDLVLAKPWRLLGPNRVSRREARYETRDALVDGKMD